MTEPSSESGLHEYIDAEIILSEAVTPMQEQTLRDALAVLKGVQDVSMAGEKVSVNYEPVLVTEMELIAALERAGVQVKEHKTTSSSPMTDAFAEQLQPPEARDDR